MVRSYQGTTHTREVPEMASSYGEELRANLRVALSVIEHLEAAAIDPQKVAFVAVVVVVAAVVAAVAAMVMLLLLLLAAVVAAVVVVVMVVAVVVVVW
jgi:hypothetical protein